MAPGAFFVLAMLVALQNKLKAASAGKSESPKEKHARREDAQALYGCGLSGSRR